MTRVLVAGAHNFYDREWCYRALDAIHKDRQISLIIEGGARGTDTLARDWAQAQNVKFRTFPAQWELYLGDAGWIRNREMLKVGKPDLFVPFPGGEFTRDLIAQAAIEGVPIRWP